MVIVDKYVNLRIGNDFTDSSSYLPAHDVVKHMRISNGAMFTNEYTLDKPIRLSFITGTRLLVLLSQFENDDTIDLDVSYDSETEEDEYYALKVVLVGKDLSITEICADKRFDTINIQPLSDEIINKLLNKDDSVMCFDISKDDMRAIKNLGNIDKDGKRFKYVVENRVLSIREPNSNDENDDESEIYNKTLCNDIDSEDKVYLCNKNVFSVINNVTDYNVCICEGDMSKVIYTHDEDDICLNVIASI
jgi:hypothetical protein